MNSRRAFTLTELLIAVTMVGMILLSIVSLDVSSRRLFFSSYYQARVLNQVSPIMELIVRDAGRAIGNKNNIGISVPDSSNIIIRHIDRPADNNFDYADFSDDTFTAYRFNNNTIERQACGTDPSCSGAYTKIADNILDCGFSLSANVVSITITAKRDVNPSSTVDPNPEVRLETSVNGRLQAL